MAQGTDMPAFRYRGFISYSHQDKAWADWLHKALETYRIPRRLVGQETAAGVVPKRLTPIFRDRDELASADDLGRKVNEALEGSANLIVICSPRSASSRWVNEEVLAYKRLGRGERIFCLIVSGEPNASDLPGRESEECFAPALRYMHERFGISRAVLPRVLSVQQVERLCEQAPVPLEVFAFGSLCIMVEGRCQLSSYVTGASPNRHGVCSPASFVRWEEHDDGGRSVRLNRVLIDRFDPSEPAGYPTVCKGRYAVGSETFHALEEPTSLNTLELLPRLASAGVAALKIEGRQRGVAYVASVTRTWREALDRYRASPERWQTRPEWQSALAKHAEGHQTTLGPYHRHWH